MEIILADLFFLINWGILSPFFYSILATYGAVFIFFVAIFRSQSPVKTDTLGNKRKVSVVCTARDEAQNIAGLLTDLSRQSYSSFDVYLFDNESKDATAEIAQSYANSLNINIIPFKTRDGFSPKKMAITWAVELSDADVFVCVDADCRVGEQWLESIIGFGEFDFLAGSVCIEQETGFIEVFQSLEFCLLMLVTGSLFNLRQPIMANGANMAFTRKAFLACGGYKKNLKVISGDDEFLLHSMKKKFPNGLYFNFDKKSIVKTKAHSNLYDLLNQKTRWASKWKHNLNWIKAGLIGLIFFSNLAVFYAVLVQNFYLIIVKFCIDFFVLWGSLVFFDKKRLWVFVPISIILYPIYAIWVAFFSSMGTYVWKGRTYKA